MKFLHQIYNETLKKEYKKESQSRMFCTRDESLVNKSLKKL